VRASDFWMRVDKTSRYLGRGALRGMREQWWNLRPVLAQCPVFVIGCSRAGTTLVYKTFSESRELGSLQRETHDFWADLHPISERNWHSHAIEVDQASLRDRQSVSRLFYLHSGTRRFVDKNNQNGLSIPYLHALFPDARFVYLKRSPGDNINSLVEGWGRPAKYATWSESLPAKVAIDNGRYTRWCFFLSEGWREHLSDRIEEVCAFQYRSMNEAILKARESIPSGQWAEIFYEDLVRDPVSGFRAAFGKIGIEFDEHLANHCATVLSTPYDAFSEIRLDKWKHSPHRIRIGRVLPSVASIAGDMGYSV